MTPVGGKTLEAIRHAGQRPPGFIVVTESRRVARNARQRELYPLVFDVGKSYDWRLIHGLDVGLVTFLKREEVVLVCQQILEAEPQTFYATYVGDEHTEHDAIIPYATR